MKNDDIKSPQDETASQPKPDKKSEAAELLKDWSPDIAESATDVGDDTMDATITDPKTDEAVSDIVAHESDEVLAVEDAVNEAENTPEPKPSPWRRFKAWLKTSQARWVIASAVAIVIVVSIVVPSIRYFLLNAAGVRGTSSVTVLDLSTQQPLKNSRVQIGTEEGLTDSEGNITLSGLKLGSQRVIIEKLAFSTVDKPITIGWGSNPQGTVELTPTGAQYVFQVNDTLTAKPLSKVELTSGQSNARTDDAGRAVLTIEEPGEKSFDVEFVQEGYRTDTVSVEPAITETTEVKLASAAQHVFISKRSGNYDMYSIYSDGKQESLLLKASGSERDNDMTIVPHPSDSTVAYVSTRSNQTNADGYLLSSLVLVDVNNKETTHVATTERIIIVGWANNRLVYIQISEGQSAANDQRYRLMSYDTASNNSTEIVAADYINDAKLFGGQLFYATGGGLQPDKAKLYRTNPDGSNAQTMLDQEVWNIVRVDVDELALNTSDQRWFTYQRGASKATPRSTAPADVFSRTYIDSPNGKYTAWIDERDGKGVLIVYDFTTKTEEAIVSSVGVNYPLSWLTDSALIYRVTSPTETADYIVDAVVKTPQKLTDVTATRGLGSR